MMIGSDRYSTFIKLKKGKRVTLSNGTFVETILTLETTKRISDDKIDDMLYSK